jgi:predicted CoA-binding protein
MTTWQTNLIDDDAGLITILRETKTIAVLGAKADRGEPAYYVPAYLAARGYHILPVNPVFAGRQLHGARVVGTLADLGETPDLVDVFRRPEYLVDHAREILALSPRPSTVWFQLGIVNDEAAERLARAGIRVVQNRCMMPDHRRLVREV